MAAASSRRSPCGVMNTATFFPSDRTTTSLECTIAASNAQGGSATTVPTATSGFTSGFTEEGSGAGVVGPGGGERRGGLAVVLAGGLGGGLGAGRRTAGPRG